MILNLLNNDWFAMSIRRMAMVGLVSLVTATLIVACDGRPQATPTPDPTQARASSLTDARTAVALVRATSPRTSSEPIGTATSEPAITPTATATTIPTREPAAAPTSTATPERANTPTATATTIPTREPTAAPTVTVTPERAITPTPTTTTVPNPTREPTAAPTRTATPERAITPTPTTTTVSNPTDEPTAAPTNTTTPERAIVPTAGKLFQIAEIDLELAQRAAGYVWVADGVTGDEWIPLAQILGLAKIDLETARLMVNSSWVADFVTKDELQGMIALRRIAGHDPEVARLAFDQPFMAPPFRHRDALALWGLYWLVYRSSESQSDFMALVADQPWFQDGVDDSEAALLKVFEVCTNEYMRALIESHYIQSASIELPLAGNVELVVISRTPIPPENSTLVAMEEGIRAIEEFMGTPFPINDVILLVIDPDIWQRSAGSVVGGYEPGFDGRIILVNDRKAFVEEGRYRGVIHHELGHFYSPTTPRWLSEGGAEFLRAYTRDKIGTESIEQRLEYLQTPEGIAREAGCDKENIQQHQGDYRPNNCDYYLGEIFLLAMYTVLGEDGASAALGDLRTQIALYGSTAPDDLIYQTFEKYTPAGKEDAFRATFQRYHGAPIIALLPPSPDRQTTLVALYNATLGRGWVNSDNWMSDTPLGTWHGVITAAGDQITGVVLKNNELSGEIPPELGSLTNLKELVLSSNELTGAIPPELGSLTNLKVLNLGANQLSGEIPPELGDLINLEELFLGENPFAGTIPPELGGLANLGILYLDAAQLRGEIPPELGRLTNLRGLRLEFNRLTGEIPLELGRLTRLWRLDLEDNQLSGNIPPDLANLSGLGLLNLSGNQLVGEIPPELGNFPNLTRALILSRNRLVGEIPSQLGRLTEVGQLDLSDNHLVGEIPPELGRLTELGVLDLSRNRLSGAIPPELGDLSSLWRLYLSGNQLSGEISPELGRLTELRTLDLSQNQLTGEIPAELGRLPYLTELFLSGNHFSGCIPQELRDIPTNDFAELGVPFCGADS